MNTLDNKQLELNCPEGWFTFLDAYDKPYISNFLEDGYLPKLERTESSGTDKKNIFIKKDDTIINGDKILKVIYFHLNKYGRMLTSKDQSYIQLGFNPTGFLARVSISRNNYTPHALTLDYLIDLQRIYYEDAQVISANKSNQIEFNSRIVFQNIDFSQYNTIEMDNRIREFSLHKEKLFEDFFE